MAGDSRIKFQVLKQTNFALFFSLNSLLLQLTKKTVILLNNGEFSATKVFFDENIKSKMMKIKFDFYYSLDLLNNMQVFFSAQRA